MFRTLQRRREDQDGFTLIELMVVVLIIAILVAIAIPTFLGARQRAQDKSAQSSLRNTLTAAKVIFTDGENYQDATTTALLAVEPSLTFKAAGTASTGPKDVSVNGFDADNFYAAALSSSGTCFYIHDIVGAPGTEYASGTGTCDGTTAATVGYSAAW